MKNKIYSIFNKMVIRGLGRIGDILAPENECFPAFSKTEASQNIDRLFNNISLKQGREIKILFLLFNFLPVFLIRFIFIFLEWISPKSFYGSPSLKKIRLGLRGIVFGLYYSEFSQKDTAQDTPLGAIEYSTRSLRN